LKDANSTESLAAHGRPTLYDGLLQPLLALVVACGGGLLVWSAWRVRFVMDEMGILTQFGFFRNLYFDLDPIKTVLGIYYFNLPRLITNDSVHLLLAGRALGLLLAAVMLLIAWCLGRNLTRSALGAWAATATLLACTNFAERSFRLRTDGAAATCAAIALLLVVRGRGRSSATWAAGVASGLGFLCTQKSIFASVAIGIGLLLSSTTEARALTRGLVQSVRFAIGWSSMVVAYSVAFGGPRFPEVFAKVFLSPGRFALATASAYEGLEHYVFDSLRQNAMYYALAAVALGRLLRCWRQLDAGARAGVVATLVLTPLVLTHSQPWPYTLVVWQVFLIPWVATLVAGPRPFTGRLQGAVRWGLLAALLLSAPRAAIYPVLHTNHEQLQTIREIEPLLAPTDRYFDGLGMIPSRHIAGPTDAWWWDRPTILAISREVERGDLSTIERILTDQPKLWILNYRTTFLMKRIGERLSRSYARVSPSVLMSGTVFSPGEVEREFHCVWPGTYRLYSPEGLPLADSVASDGGDLARRVVLTAGVHLLRRSSGEEVSFLLPVDAGLTGPFPTRPTPAPNLFEKVYDF